MTMFSSRSNELEIMDDLSCSGEVVHQTLKELDFINQWLGGNKITLNGIEILLSRCKPAGKINIADIGCGSGDMLRLVHDELKKNGIQPILSGFDANPNIIAFAASNSKGYDGLTFKTENIFNESFKKEKFDIVSATLFLHHFANEELIGILRSLRKQVRVGIIVNDLHRHPLAYYSIRLLTLLFSRSAMVKYDAPLSVLRGFARREWVEILDKAEIKSYSLRWKWAFRWQLIIPASE